MEAAAVTIQTRGEFWALEVFLNGIFKPNEKKRWERKGCSIKIQLLIIRSPSDPLGLAVCCRYMASKGM